MKTNENGRSMVEMLGVLAIIGVLSVGAIAGYSKAMFKYKMNKTLDILSHAVNRVAELETMNLGTEIRGASDAKKYGIFPDCDINYTNQDKIKGYSCQIPLGEVSFAFYSTSSHKISGQFYIKFIEEPFDSCVTFLNSGIYKSVPKEWWGYINTYGNGSSSFYGVVSDTETKLTVTNQDILNACEICKNKSCGIDWIIRMEI